MEHIDLNVWFLSSVILGLVVISKIISKVTKTVDVLWLIVFGALFSNLGIIPEHHEIIENIGEWGIIFVMFALGFDEDLSHFISGLKKSWGIAVIGAIFPFIAGYWTASIFGYGHNSAMLWGLTMTATAVSLTMMSLKSENMHRSTAATGIMTAAVIDDVLSLIGVAIIVPLVLASAGDVSATTGGVNFEAIALIILKVLIFFAITLFLGLIAFPERTPIEYSENEGMLQRLTRRAQKLLSFLGIRKLLIAYEGEFTPLVMVAIAMTMGFIAEKFGFHPAIGAYLAGLFLKREYFVFSNENKSESETNSHYQQSKFVIDHLAFTIFGPIFFVNLGSKIVFDLDVLSNVLPITLILFILVFLFQVFSAMFAARFTGKYTWHESVMIGFGMLGRAELAFIVINIAYVQSKIISLEQFYALIFTTFLLNISVPLTIKFWKPYYLGDKELKIFGVILSKNK